MAESIGDGRAEIIRAKQDHVAPECYCGRHGKATDFYALGWLVVHVTTAARPYHFDSNRERDYRVAAHCLERLELPVALPAEWRSLVGNWIAKEPGRRLLGYDLDTLMAQAQVTPCDVDASVQDCRNIGRTAGFLRPAEACIPYAQHELAVRMLKEGQCGEALFWLEKAAAAGYARSACRLALALMEPDFAPADARRARELLLAAGQAGNAEASYRLGRLLLDEGDTGMALVWLQRAADAGHRNAQYRYATTGRGQRRAVEGSCGLLRGGGTWVCQGAGPHRCIGCKRCGGAVRRGIPMNKLMSFPARYICLVAGIFRSHYTAGCGRCVNILICVHRYCEAATWCAAFNACASSYTAIA